METARAVVLSAIVTAFAGCQSWEVRQANIFSDEDGRIVRVEYGRSESVHRNKFISPVTGKEMDFESKLVVRVTMPDGDRFTAWQCMNFLRSGTMYKTDNEQWMVLANGFSTIVYAREKDSGRYAEAYRGVLCETTDKKAAKDDRWRDLKKDSRGKWK